MAAEMSCLTGVDEDDKDADPEINALTLLQEPVRMAQESASCTDSFGKPSLKQNSVLDVLSNTDMLSPVGLGNGPSSHQATQAHELNSISTEKEEAKSITPLKTVQEIDTAGIWGFDVDSPENSVDNFSGASDLHWDPHKEFMQFLWENHGDSPGEEPKDEVLPANSQRRRKRKMDMVVMVDPSEDLYPDLSCKSSEDLSDAEDQEDSIPVRKVRKSRKFSQSQSSPTGKVSKYPNGTVKAIKEILYNAPARNSHENSIGHGLSPLKGRLTMNSHSEDKPSCYHCSKCKLIFKKEHHLHRHMKSHVDSPDISPKPFICRECGQSFRQSGSLIEHMSSHTEKTARLHTEKKARLTEEIKCVNDQKKEDKKKLFCPQCPFGTNCPNTFVQHAKTHEKDKRKFRCDKCSFRSLSESDLRRHNIMQHTVITVTKQIQNDDSGIFSCNICSYRAFSENVFKNHLLRRHQQTFEEYEAAQRLEKTAQPLKEQHMPTSKTVEDAEFTSKISIKNQISSKRACSPSESNDIADLFKNSKIKRGLKSQLTESKLDKSINVLLSRQRHGKKTAEPRKESNNHSTFVQDSIGDKDDSDQLPGTLSVKVEDSAISPNGHMVSSSPPEGDQSTVRKSPSKRKMSTPYRNTSDQDSCFILPKPLPSPKKINQEEEEEEVVSDSDEKDIFQFNDTDGNTDLFDNGIKKENQNIIYTYSRRISMRGALQASKRLFEKIKTEDEDPTEPEIKEECIETEVFQEAFDSHQIPLREDFTEDLSDLELDRKNCPYCPAVFESGVGLSNHVRGHLHRVGLAYNARHVVSPEQVASQDRRPRIRRKMSAIRRLKKALQLESESETVKSIHSCPLCGDSFDNRTGQSNHIRGHLKKLGKSFATKNKSPLFLLRELMRDKKEFQRALQILGKRRNHFQYGASSKLSTVDHFMQPPIGIPKCNSIPSACTDDRPLMPTFSLVEMESEKRQIETKLDVKNSLSGTTALIGILKKRKCQEDSRIKGSSQMSKNMLAVSSNSEHCSGSRVASSLPKSICEKGEFNRKVCVHCNATFHSGVSLSNHLRAYAKRKRTAVLDGTTFDCKARRQRSRPGSKKKTLPLPQTPEEMYRLTCRFCDLVFQGPLSVQEDWIKHLQRHIMNTSIPHTGLGMVEVASLPTDPPTLKTDQDRSLTAALAAS
ncbi:zinc finger protein 644a [Perca flavescens]|uniref:zinc finger protein 644a n=1 Tax=Perca flavescens TaxID=8167 RepID=UPI00106E5E99|nr:zinc finger protein 644-like [Perca flavescens]XP_028449994.1 zinc finger protein 644-like [Perca flavescens]XP_028449995.1 zinc finger protein 644-like [Perca flavescens]XP_028449996.1 zinc finger protein 644-like [Perca flavescens]